MPCHELLACAHSKNLPHVMEKGSSHLECRKGDDRRWMNAASFYFFNLTFFGEGCALSRSLCKFVGTLLYAAVYKIIYSFI